MVKVPIHEAVTRLGKSESTIRRGIRAGEIQAQMVDGKWLVDVPPNEEAVASHDQSPDPAAPSQVDQRELRMLSHTITLLEVELEARRREIQAKDDQIASLNRQNEDILAALRSWQERMLPAPKKRNSWWLPWRH